MLEFITVLGALALMFKALMSAKSEADKTSAVLEALYEDLEDREDTIDTLNSLNDEISDQLDALRKGHDYNLKDLEEARFEVATEAMYRVQAQEQLKALEETLSCYPHESEALDLEIQELKTELKRAERELEAQRLKFENFKDVMVSVSTSFRDGVDEMEYELDEY